MCACLCARISAWFCRCSPVFKPVFRETYKYPAVDILFVSFNRYLSHLMTKPTKWHVRPAKTQISLGIRPVWSEFSLSAWRKLGSSATHWAHIEDSDQTGWMSRLIWVFAGRTCYFVGFVMRWLICLSFILSSVAIFVRMNNIIMCILIYSALLI